MNKINNNGMSHEVVATYFGIRESEITNIVVKFVRRAIKEQDEIGCTVMTETFAAGAEKYRITIEGAYNDLQDGGMKKTDYCFAKISFEIKGVNGRFVPYGDNWVRDNGISHGTYVDSIYNAIFDYFADDLVIRASYDDYAKEIVALAEQKYIAEQEERVQDTIADYESEQEDISEEELEKMDDCVAEFQPIFEDYVQDLRYVADNYGKLSTKCECFAAKEIVKKIKDLGETLLRALGNITGCNMVEEDGHWFDTSSLEEWYRDECGRLFYDDFMHLSDIEDLIDALGNMTCIDSDMPLGIDKETLDFELGGYEDETSFLGLVADYPSYIWDELRDFISTYYHYAYCA